MWDWILDLTHRVEDFSSAGMWTGLSWWITVDPDQHLVGANATWIDGHASYVNTPASSDRDLWVLTGMLMLAEHNGSGTVVYLVAPMPRPGCADVGLGPNALHRTDRLPLLRARAGSRATR